MADVHLKLAKEVSDAHSHLNGTERAIANTEQSLASLREQLPLAEARYAAAVKAIADYYAPLSAPELPKKAKQQQQEDIKKMIM